MWATGYTFSARDLFAALPTKKIKISRKDLLKYFKVHKKTLLATRIFIYCVKIILLDIINNNVTFKLPTKSECYIEMLRHHGDDFIAGRKNGAYQDVDYLKSDFTAYTLSFRYIASERTIRKDIHVSGWMRDMITENTNNGMQYY